MAGPSLASALEAHRERLLPCVHCGFCLPACPTYNRLGDEADSPRGRLHLMGAVVEGRLDPASDAFRTHIDRCLGCRACEPVCPSGVEYGTLLELARDTAARHRPPGRLTRILLAVMGSPRLRGAVFGPARLLRGLGVAAFAARSMPSAGPLRAVRLGLAMLAASEPWKSTSAAGRRGEPAADAPVAADTGEDGDDEGSGSPEATRAVGAATEGGRPSRGLRVGLLAGCVQAGLYGHLNSATRRVLEANGFEVVAVAGQDCCGALHAHGGDLATARALARSNIEAFERAALDRVAVNTAGCGATMKDYAVLLEDEGDVAARAARFAASVRDVTEILAEVGPRRGAAVSCSVAYDHPCHLLHGQGVRREPLDVLDAIPGVEVRLVDNADECCGGAGIYGITHPDLGGEIGRDKVDAVRRARTDLVCTPNPGCMMQIGAGLRLVGADQGVVHPVELLDESYRRAGYYSS